MPPADPAASAEGRSPLRGRIRTLAKRAVAAALILLVVPPLALAAGDLWLLVRAGPERGDEARRLIMQGIRAGRDRSAERRWILSDRTTRTPAVADAPMSVYQPLAPHPAEAIPMCAGQAVGESGPGTRPIHAHATVEHERLRLATGRLGLAGLLAYDACLNASPFAAWCEARFARAERSSQAEIEAAVVRSGVARREKGRACWCAMPCNWRAAGPPPPARN